MRERTYEVMLRQTQAMDTKVFEVGLFNPPRRQKCFSEVGIRSGWFPHTKAEALIAATSVPFRQTK
jgi:hypothetical protein